MFESDEDTDTITKRGAEVPVSPKKRGGNDYFLMRKRGLVRNPDYRKLMKGPTTLYEYIWANIVRDYMHNDPHNIKEKYYDKGFLAYCSSYRHLAEKCFMDKNTVMKYIKNFVDNDIIKTDAVGPKNRPQTVFILGTWQKEKEEGREKIKECYYIDDKFYK